MSSDNIRGIVCNLKNRGIYFFVIVFGNIINNLFLNRI